MNNLKGTLLSGFLWTGFQTVGTKLISLISQLLLAWLLVPDDFGKIGIASSITGIIFLIQTFGLSDVLISRNKVFDHTTNLAKSISLVMGSLCLILTFTSSFFAQYIYQDSEIRNIILIFCLSIPFSTMSVVSDAKLRIDLRFRELSIVKVVEFLVSQFSIILFVVVGFGVYSFVLGPFIGAVIRYFWLINLSGLTHTFKITFHHWRFLFSNSLYGFFHSICQSVIRQSDYLILGLFASKSEVGIYFLGYSLSVQVIGFLVNSLAPILFPSLMKIPINEKGRIKNVLMKITIVFAFLGMPFAFWQTSIIEPLVLVFFQEKWYDMIPVVQILSLGIGFNVISSLWGPALRIKSKFKEQSIYSFCFMVFFISLITPFSYLYGIKGIAIAVSMYYFVSGPLLLYLSFGSYGVSWSEILNVIFKYFGLSLITYGTVYFLTFVFDFNLYLSLIFNGLFSPIFYFGILTYKDENFMNFLEEIKIKSFLSKIKVLK